MVWLVVSAFNWVVVRDAKLDEDRVGICVTVSAGIWSVVSATNCVVVKAVIWLVFSAAISSVEIAGTRELYKIIDGQGGFLGIEYN